MNFANKLSTARKIWELLTHADRRSAVILLGLMLVGMILETLGVGMVIPAVALLTQDNLAQNYPVLKPALQAIGNPSKQNLIIGGMLFLVSVYLIKVVFLALLAWRQARFAFDAQAQLSQRLFTLYLRQPYTFHLQRNSAQLIRNIVNEVNLFTVTGMLPCMVLLTESLVVIGLFCLLLAVEPLGATVVVSVLGAAGWGFFRVTKKRITRWGKARQHHEGLRIQHLQEGLGGAKDVKLLGREADFLEMYRRHNTESARIARMQATVQQLPRLWLELLAVAGLALLVISMLLQNRPLDAILPTLGLFAAAAFRLIPSVNRMVIAGTSLRYGVPAINTLHTEMQLAVAEENGAPGQVLFFKSMLELSGVSYVYPNAAAPSLNDVSLVVRRGESVGFIGASGAGKSTLVDVLLGLLKPVAGELKVDGNNVHPNLRSWQDQIGYVPQTIFLTDDTLRRNVAFGIPKDQIDELAVRRAIKAAQLEGFVAELPEGLETQVGERGVRLSGGQRQRVGIARALYHDPDVLVLDEATSSLDTSTEADVMQAITSLQGSKTILIVAHRLSTVEHCDRLYQMEEGRVVAEGKPGDVLPATLDVSAL